VTRRESSFAGRIPFRIRIGVTGHRNVEREANLTDLPRRIRELVPTSEATPVRLAVVSALAEGADRLIVDAVFDHAEELGEDARLEVVLPFAGEDYTKLQDFSPAAKAEFDDWLRRATAVVDLGAASDLSVPEMSYEAAGQRVVNRCDILVALWDGSPSGGRGGTAETLLYAAEVGKPCIWIPTDGNGSHRDNLREGSGTAFLEDVRRRAAVSRPSSTNAIRIRPRALDTLEEAFDELDAFNRPALPSVSKLTARLSQEFGEVDLSSRWVTDPFLRATLLAERYQSWFVRATWLMSTLATGAAASLAMSVIQKDGSTIWGWTEVACLVALVGVFASIHRRGLHRRWLSYRLLAERFRSAYFIAPTGIDFRGTTGLESVFVERQAADWLLRGFEEVWDSRPQARAPDGPAPELDVETLRHRLAEVWVGGQIAYHAKACARHERRAQALTVLVIALFFGSLVSATLHAMHVMEKPSIFFSITLPVAAAAVGVILTVRQHRALAERYRAMEADLVSAQRSLRDMDAHTMTTATSEAARVIAAENGDWLGAMWFLDVEHPP
jgi:hypothetical protein